MTNLQARLNELAQNETAKEVLEGFAIRERLTDETDLARYKNYLINLGSRIVPSDYNKLFRELHNLGFGKLVYGRGKNPSKFKWHCSLREVGNAVICPNEFKGFNWVKKPQFNVDKTGVINLNKHKDYKHVETKEIVMETKKPVEPKKPGRPKGYSPKKKALEVAAAQASIKEKETPRPGIVFMFTTESGEMIPMKLEDAEKLAEQVKTIRSKLG